MARRLRKRRDDLSRVRRRRPTLVSCIRDATRRQLHAIRVPGAAVNAAKLEHLDIVFKSFFYANNCIGPATYWTNF